MVARVERRIHRRNLREYAAGAVVVAFFTARLWHEHGLGLTSPLLVIAGAIFVMIQLYRRGTALSVPADAGTMACLQLYRLQLERQRDALHSVWRWYLLPLVPGLVAVLTATAINRGIHGRLIVVGIFFVLVFVGIWRLNERGVRKIDDKIQAVRDMEANEQ
jgi:hypothetical protein